MQSPIIRLALGKSPDFSDRSVREKCGSIGSLVGVAANLLLAVIKIATGLAFSAMSIVADGLNNLSDIGSSVITLIGFKMSAKPADREHPFGHGRIEYMSAFSVSMLMILVGVGLFKSSVKALVKGEAAPTYGMLAVVILAISAAVKLYMFCFNRTLAKKINSSSLKATAQDSINDCITTLAVLLAIAASMLFKLNFNLDAVMAALVGAFIVWSGIASAKATLDEILGGAPDKETVRELESIINSFDGFLGLHDLMLHDYGPGRCFASVHIEVPQNTDIVLCHEKIDLCEKLVFERLGIDLVIHMDPIDTDNESVLKTKERLCEKIKIIDGRLTVHDFRMTPAAKHRTNLIFDVVVPPELKASGEELKAQISRCAKELDSSFCCVIKLDSDFTGGKP